VALHAVATDGQQDADWRAGYDATMQHLALLQRKEERLRQARIDAEEQLLHALAAAYRAGQVSPGEMSRAYAEFKAVAAVGFSTRWDAALPEDASAARARWIGRGQPSTPQGTWDGVFPLGFQDPAPPHGVSVVYVLFDPVNVPCYVGSTKDFRGRLKRHGKEGKDFSRWTAHPCQDRAHAYELEDRLLKEHKPYLNKKRGR
jgi:hypothetical protein